MTTREFDFDEVGWPLLYFDRTGTPISAKRWSDLFEDNAYRFLRDDTVGESRVTTVWQGVNDMLCEPPHIFGTLVRHPQHETERTHVTEAAALRFHDRVVRLLRRMHARTPMQSKGPVT